MSRALREFLRVPQTNPPYQFLFERRGPWWREWELVLLVALALGIYFVRPADPAITSDEGRTGRIAWEMLHSGQWLVPKIQGEPRLGRPPLGDWLVALTGLVTGSVSSFAVRFPSLMATLGTAILVYGYSRGFLKQTGAFAAAMAFLTFYQVLVGGRLGDGESLLAFCVAGAFLTWHWGWTAGWPDLPQWTIPYLFVAAGVLASGIWVAVYFWIVLTFYVFGRRQEERAISLGHLFAFLLAFALVMAWKLSYADAVGQPLQLLGSDFQTQLATTPALEFLQHAVMFPILVFVAALFPWGFLLLAYLAPTFRQTLGSATRHCQFLVLAIALPLIVGWLSPRTSLGMLLPLFSFAAILIGIVVERAAQPGPTLGWQKLWPQFLDGCGVLLVAAAALLVTFAEIPATWELVLTSRQLQMLTLPSSGAWLLLVTTIAAALLLWRFRQRNAASALVATAVLSAVLGAAYVGPVLTLADGGRERVEKALARIQDRLPKETELVSFGAAHHQFLMPFGRPVERLAWPRSIDDVPEDVDYFCVTLPFYNPQTLPFDWETVASIPNVGPSGKVDGKVIIGRRIVAPLTVEYSRPPRR